MIKHTKELNAFKEWIKQFICVIICIITLTTPISDAFAANYAKSDDKDGAAYYVIEGKSVEKLFDFSIYDIPDVLDWVLQFKTYTVIKDYTSSDGEQTYKCYFNTPNVQSIIKNQVTSVVDDGYTDDAYNVDDTEWIVPVGSNAKKTNAITRYGFNIPNYTYMGEYPKEVMTPAGIIPSPTNIIDCIIRFFKSLFGGSILKPPDADNFKSIRYINHEYTDKEDFITKYIQDYYLQFIEARMISDGDAYMYDKGEDVKKNGSYFESPEHVMELTVSEEAYNAAKSYNEKHQDDYIYALQHELWWKWYNSHGQYTTQMQLDTNWKVNYAKELDKVDRKTNPDSYTFPDWWGEKWSLIDTETTTLPTYAYGSEENREMDSYHFIASRNVYLRNVKSWINSNKLATYVMLSCIPDKPEANKVRGQYEQTEDANITANKIYKSPEDYGFEKNGSTVTYNGDEETYISIAADIVRYTYDYLCAAIKYDYATKHTEKHWQKTTDTTKYKTTFKNLKIVQYEPSPEPNFKYMLDSDNTKGTDDITKAKKYKEETKATYDINGNFEIDGTKFKLLDVNANVANPVETLLDTNGSDDDFKVAKSDQSSKYYINSDNENISNNLIKYKDWKSITSDNTTRVIKDDTGSYTHDSNNDTSNTQSVRTVSNHTIYVPLSKNGTVDMANVSIGYGIDSNVSAECFGLATETFTNGGSEYIKFKYPTIITYDSASVVKTIDTKVEKRTEVKDESRWQNIRLDYGWDGKDTNNGKITSTDGQNTIYKIETAGTTSNAFYNKFDFIHSNWLSNNESYNENAQPTSWFSHDDFVPSILQSLIKNYEANEDVMQKYRTFERYIQRGWYNKDVDYAAKQRDKDRTNIQQLPYRQCMIQQYPKADSDDEFECKSTKYSKEPATITLADVIVYSGVYKTTAKYREKNYKESDGSWCVLSYEDARKIQLQIQLYCGDYYTDVMANMMKLILYSATYGPDKTPDQASVDGPAGRINDDDPRIMPYDVSTLTKADADNYEVTDPRVTIYKDHIIGGIISDFTINFGFGIFFKPQTTIVNLAGKITEISVFLQELCSFDLLDDLGLSPASMWDNVYVTLFYLAVVVYFIIKTVIAVIKMGTKGASKIFIGFAILILECGFIAAIAANPEGTWNKMKNIINKTTTLGEVAAVYNYDDLKYLFSDSSDTEVVYYLPYLDTWSQYNTGYGLMKPEQLMDSKTDYRELAKFHNPQINNKDIRHWSILLADSFEFHGKSDSYKGLVISEDEKNLENSVVINGPIINSNAYRVVDHFMAPRPTIGTSGDNLTLKVTQNEFYNGEFQTGFGDILIKLANCCLGCFLSIIKMAVLTL